VLVSLSFGAQGELTPLAILGGLTLAGVALAALTRFFGRARRLSPDR